MPAALTTSLAETVRAVRERHRLSVAALAERSGVSRAMISKIERGDAQPTAVLLARLSAAFDMTLSQLIAAAEDDDRRLVRRDEQRLWVDPVTGYTRRTVSPTAGRPLELAEVELPGGATVAYPAGSYTFAHQQIWMLSGKLRLREGDHEYDLFIGDCLQLGPPTDRTYTNPSAKPCRYLVALTREPG
jgi:transcriptional regulator with XRE-family HTH domain